MIAAPDRPASEIAAELAIRSNLLYKWKEYLERKGRNPKKGSSVLCSSVQVKYGFIRENRSAHSVSTLCDVLGISCSGYHDWLDRPM
jgi:transposase-like protein